MRTLPDGDSHLEIANDVGERDGIVVRPARRYRVDPEQIDRIFENERPRPLIP
jgi:hypothetical protein